MKVHVQADASIEPTCPTLVVECDPAATTVGALKAELHSLAKATGVFDLAADEMFLTYIHTPLTDDAAPLTEVGIGAPAAAGVAVTEVAGVQLARRRGG